MSDARIIAIAPVAPTPLTAAPRDPAPLTVAPLALYVLAASVLAVSTLAGAPVRLRHALLGLAGRLRRLTDRLRQRHHLRQMAEDYPDYLLRDVGLRREDLLREAGRSLWRG